MQYMALEEDSMTSSPDLPLGGVRVVDLTSDLGRLPGRLLADLGADVIRVRTPRTGLDPQRGPQIDMGNNTTLGADYIVATLGQRIEQLDPAEPAGARRLAELLDGADMLITDQAPRQPGEQEPDLGRGRPALVHVAISPYGLDGPYADRPATDLTLLAAGGLLNLAGQPDRAPVRPAGDLASFASGLHATVGALIALLERKNSGQGQIVDVSAQQAVAHSLENAIQYADLEGVVRGRTAGNPEAGNGLFRCHDGWIYLVAGVGGTPLGWPGLLAWLEESGTDTTDLASSRWQDADWRRTPEAAARFRELFEAFTSGRAKAELYESGQRHRVSLAPVATPADLLASPQLADRGFFRTVSAADRQITVPGAPYRFDGVDVGPRGGPALPGEADAFSRD
jgi:benzylsuccinate CoA-transferase BbsE subunit